MKKEKKIIISLSYLSVSFSLSAWESVEERFCEMLARAPPPSFTFPARNKVCNRREIVRLFRNGGGGGVVARAGFTRRPLETSCSYEVDNDSTDDGFVIIKAADQENGFYPPPPSDLLSSTPSGI